MEPKDIIDRQTLERLNKPNPSSKDLADGIKLIASKLWSKDEMTDFIDSRHAELCSRCPRFAVPAAQPAGDAITVKLVAIVGSISSVLATIATALVAHFCK